jgi:hypothetical protein
MELVNTERNVGIQDRLMGMWDEKPLATVFSAAEVQNPRTYALYAHMNCNSPNSLYE